MSPGSPPGPPPMLMRLYGAGKVLCLRDLLLEMSKSSRDAEGLRETLVQPLDHTDYSHNLLTGTFCIIKPGAPPLAEGFSLKQSSDQLQASKHDLWTVDPLSMQTPFINFFFIVFCSCCTVRLKLFCSLSREKLMFSAMATARSVQNFIFYFINFQRKYTQFYHILCVKRI
jgi:hypothetical protein